MSDKDVPMSPDKSIHLASQRTLQAGMPRQCRRSDSFGGGNASGGDEDSGTQGIGGNGGGANNKRQRVSRACDLCRRKKVKCDGALPVCSNCQAFGLECAYNDATKKRGPPKGYIEAIEGRLHRMESLLEGLAQINDPRAQALLAELNSPLETPGGERIQAKSRRRLPSEQAGLLRVKQAHAGDFQDDDESYGSGHRQAGYHGESEESPPMLGDDPWDGSTMYNPDGSDPRGVLSKDENGQLRYHGKSSGLYLLRNTPGFHHGVFHYPRNRRISQMHQEGQSASSRLNRSCSVSNLPPPLVPAPTVMSATPYRPQIDPYQTPPPDVAEALVTIYFQYFHPTLPMIHRQSFLESFYSSTHPPSLILLNAIFAIAARVSDDPRLRSPQESIWNGYSEPAAQSQPLDNIGDIFFERALLLFEADNGVSRSSSVQALILMAIHQQGALKSARAWLLSGMAIRMAQDLGLNRNCENWGYLRTECESRNRVFWTCFVIDRIFSAVYGRSLTIDDRDCDALYPREEDGPWPTRSDGRERAPNTNEPIIAHYCHFIKLCEILGRVLQNIYSVKARLVSTTVANDRMLSMLDSSLKQWYDNLPVHLKYPTLSASSQTMARQAVTPSSLAIYQTHLLYHTIIILLHRPFINLPDLPPAAPSSFPSVPICTKAATSILEIAEVMQSQQLLRGVWNFATFEFYTAGMTFARNLAHVPDNADPSQEHHDPNINQIRLTKILGMLLQLRSTWRASDRLHYMLSLGRYASNSIANGNGGEFAQTPRLAKPEPTMPFRPTPTNDVRFNKEPSVTSTPIYTPTATTVEPENPFLMMDPFAAPGSVASSMTRMPRGQAVLTTMGSELWTGPETMQENQEWPKRQEEQQHDGVLENGTTNSVVEPVANVVYW